MQGGLKCLWDEVSKAQNMPQNHIPTEMTNGEITFKTDESLAQGFTDFFKKKVEDIIAETEIDQTVFNESKKAGVVSEIFLTYDDIQ